MATNSIFPGEILQKWVQGNAPTADDYAALAAWEQQDNDNPSPLCEPRHAALEIDPHQMEVVLELRSQLFHSLIPEFQDFCSQVLRQPQPLWNSLWQVWLPVAIQIAAHRQRLNRFMVQGVLGSQGTGKTTLTRLLQLILKHLGYRAVCLSLDDLYKTYADRQILQATDPRLIWRGPPGTHDVDLGLATIHQLQTALPGQPIALPRFDKALHQGAGDRTTPEMVQDADLLLLEGWFVGVRPLPVEAFSPAPDPIQTAADLAFALDMNQALTAYQPLWKTLDRLLVLYPKDYRLSKVWRAKAEERLRSQGLGGMCDREVEDFVEFFWKALHPDLFLSRLIQDPAQTDLVIEIQANQQPGSIWKPKI